MGKTDRRGVLITALFLKNYCRALTKKPEKQKGERLLPKQPFSSIKLILFGINLYTKKNLCKPASVLDLRKRAVLRHQKKVLRHQKKVLRHQKKGSQTPKQSVARIQKKWFS